MEAVTRAILGNQCSIHLSYSPSSKDYDKHCENELSTEAKVS